MKSGERRSRLPLVSITMGFAGRYVDMVEKLRRFTIEHQIMAAILFAVVTELIFRIDLVERIIPEPWQLGGTIDRCIYTALGMLFIVFFMKNSLKEIGYSSYNLKEGLKLSLLIVLIALTIQVLIFLSNVISGAGHFMNTPEEILSFFDNLLFYFSVGLFEETVYRAVPVNILRNKEGLNDRQLMFYSLIISSLIFGLSHIANMISGFDTPVGAIGRAIQATGSGMLFGAIYWRTGSLLASVIGHSLWDACSILNDCVYIVDETAQAAASRTPSAAEALMGADLSTLFTGVCLFVLNFCIALFLLRKKKYAGCRIQAPTMREQFMN